MLDQTLIIGSPPHGYSADDEMFRDEDVWGKLQFFELRDDGTFKAEF